MRTFLIKLSLFITLVLGVQCLLPPSKDIPNEIKLLDAFMRQNADVIYFGDSTINWAAASDVNQESMPGLLQRILPSARVAKITHASYQADVYEAYAQYLLRKGYRPKFVIIPINLRSFSPEWDQQPLWQFEQEKLTLAMKDTFWMKFYRPLAVFKFFESRISRFFYEQTHVFEGEKLIGKVCDFDNASFKVFSQQNMKNKLRFRYLGQVSAEHRKIKSLVRTTEILKKAGIEPVFYVTPVDWQTLEKNLGVKSITQVASNVSVISEALDKAGVPVLDLSRALPTSEFSWPEDGEGPHYPNEHLRLRGRMLVVKSLAEMSALKQK